MPAKLASHLMLSRHGIYYLRIERDGIERRRGLRTRDPAQARAAAWRFGATIHGMSTQKTDDPLSIFTEAGAEELESLLLKIKISQLESDQKKQDMYARIDEQTRHLLPQSQPQEAPSQRQLPAASAITISDACKHYMNARTGQICIY